MNIRFIGNKHLASQTHPLCERKIIKDNEFWSRFWAAKLGGTEGKTIAPPGVNGKYVVIFFY